MVDGCTHLRYYLALFVRILNRAFPVTQDRTNQATGISLIEIGGFFSQTIDLNNNILLINHHAYKRRVRSL